MSLITRTERTRKSRDAFCGCCDTGFAPEAVRTTLLILEIVIIVVIVVIVVFFEIWIDTLQR